MLSLSEAGEEGVVSVEMLSSANFTGDEGHEVGRLGGVCEEYILYLPFVDS